MLKLAIIAGISLSALLCGMMALGGSNGLFQSGNNRNFEFLNDIKEVFGFPPKSQNQASQFTSNTGNAPSSFSFGSSGDGGYLPPKSFADDNSTYTDLTTPLFRIFVLSTTTEIPTTSSTSTVTATTGSPSTQATSTSATTTSSSTTPGTTTSASAVSSITPTTFNPSINVTEYTDKPAFKEEALAEGSTVASVSPSPTGYAFQPNPSPQFKVDLIWSTLVPPSISNAENEVTMSDNPKSTSDNAGTGGYGGGSLPNNGLYLPPNKEYLPPSSQ